MIFESFYDELPKTLSILKINSKDLEKFDLKSGNFIIFTFVSNENKKFLLRLLINLDEDAQRAKFFFPKWIELYFKKKKYDQKLFCSFKKMDNKIDMNIKDELELNIEIDFISILENDKLLNYSVYLLQNQVIN